MIKRTHYFLAALVLLLVMATLAVFSMRGDSATTDEGVHLMAGYSYLKWHDFRLDPEHPPLIKSIQAIPLLFLDLNIPSKDNVNWQRAGYYHYDSWREARQLGDDLLYNLGNNADQILFWGRIPGILMMLALGILIFIWSRQLFGDTAALLAVFLYSLCPNIIAHARLANTDLGAALFSTLALYLLWRLIKKPSWWLLLLAGFGLGLAQLTKFSLIVLMPTFLIIILYVMFRQKRFLSWLGRLLTIFVIAYLTIWLGYMAPLRGAPYPLSSFEQQNMEALSSGSVQILGTSAQRIHQFAIPPYYIKGLTTILAGSSTGRPAYLFGQSYNGGRWYYFPLSFLVKTPVITIIFIIMLITYLILRLVKFRRQIFQAPPDSSISPNIFIGIGIGIFVFVSLFNKINIGLRHILPIYPLIFILLGQLSDLKKFIIFGNERVRAVALGVMLFFYAFSSIKIYPYYLAYFNEAAGGPESGYKYLADSNIDWGQDAKRLKEYLVKNNIDNPKIDYKWGERQLDYYGIKYQKFNPKTDTHTGYIVISEFYLVGPDYDWLRGQKPVAKIGYSTYVYNLD